uniref:Uncharacterized protein n=1 Tax=Romanomermis culicivorax TaxID=13658 RepID=A0A915KV58_ROMCU
MDFSQPEAIKMPTISLMLGWGGSCDFTFAMNCVRGTCCQRAEVDFYILLSMFVLCLIAAVVGVAVAVKCYRRANELEAEEADKSSAPGDEVDLMKKMRTIDVEIIRKNDPSVTTKTTIAGQHAWQLFKWTTVDSVPGAHIQLGEKDSSDYSSYSLSLHSKSEREMLGGGRGEGRSVAASLPTSAATSPSPSKKDLKKKGHF